MREGYFLFGFSVLFSRMHWRGVGGVGIDTIRKGAGFEQDLYF